MNKRKSVLIAVLLLVGVGITAYPTISNWVNNLDGSHAIQELQTNLESADIAQQRLLAEEYNRKLRNSEEVTDEEYNLALNIANGMMGYIEIPEIEVNLPIYHGISEEVLSKAVGHMPETALPIGGEGNHTVLTGHTGLPSAELFTDLADLEEGDRFSICVLGDTLTYQIDQIKVVLPSEGEDLTRVPEKDYCTLVTCTPYGINSHRLLVRGERVMESDSEAVQTFAEETEENGFAYLWLIPLLLVGVGLMTMGLMRRKRK